MDGIWTIGTEESLNTLCSYMDQLHSLTLAIPCDIDTTTPNYIDHIVHSPKLPPFLLLHELNLIFTSHGCQASSISIEAILSMYLSPDCQINFTSYARKRNYEPNGHIAEVCAKECNLGKQKRGSIGFENDEDERVDLKWMADYGCG